MKEKWIARPLAEKVFLILAVIFLSCLLMQFLLAGMSVFDDPTNWAIHKRFVHLFGFTIPFLMIISSLLGKFFSVVYRELAAVFLLIFLMYFTANVGWQIGWLGALHPVAGVLLIAVASAAMVKVYRNHSLKVDEKTNARGTRKERGWVHWILCGAIGGFVLGILLTNLVGIISFVMFGVPMGIKFFPFYLALISSLIVPLWMNKRKDSNIG